MADNELTAMLNALLQPWHEAVKDPVRAQQEVLHRLLEIYAQTDYGRQHGAGQIETVEDYRRAFPVATYEDYRSLIQRVMGGEIGLLLSEEPVGWAITHGTTRGESKFIPMTPTDLRMRVSAGRAVMNYVAISGRYDLFQGVNLNLNFPSVVGTMGSVPGINTRYRPTLRALYGPVVIREIYGAMEGMFGQQRDDRRAWVPNYDLFFFEVRTRSGIKMNL